MADLSTNYSDNFSEDYIVTAGNTDLHCNSNEDHVATDGEPGYVLEKMITKKEPTCDNKEYSSDSCDQIDDKESLIESQYGFEDKTEMNDKVSLDNFKFIAPENVIVVDTDVSSTLEATSDPISIAEGMIC